MDSCDTKYIYLQSMILVALQIRKWFENILQMQMNLRIVYICIEKKKEKKKEKKSNELWALS